MALNISRTESSMALWSRRIAFFCLQLLILSVILHQTGYVDSPTVINIISVALIGGAAALIMAVVGLVRIWFQGLAGTGWAITAILVVALLFSVPGWFMHKLIMLPAINDISTDLQRPPAFEKLVGIRPVNTSAYPGVETAVEQAEAYPDIVPISLDRSTGSVFELIEQVVENLGWKIVASRAPSRAEQIGIIEATDKTLLLGYKDDIVVRVSGTNEQSRIDIRSASRFGKHDLGANAKRIRYFIESVKIRLAKVEATRATQQARQQIQTQKSGTRKAVKARTKKRRRSATSSSRRVRKARKRRRSKRRTRQRRRQRNRRYQNNDTFSFPF